MLRYLLFAFYILHFFTGINAKIEESVLISSRELSSIRDEPDFDKNYRIIEANFGPKGQDNFGKGHIPGAIYVDAAFNSTKLTLLEVSLPILEAWQSYLGSLGISNDHQLIIYDRSEYGFKQSSRLFYLIKLFGKNKVKVLNGGFNDWVRNRFDASTKIQKFSDEIYIASFNPKLLRLYENIIKNIETNAEILVDARNSSEYENGHIPGAFNVPYNEFFDSKTGLLKTKQELMKMVLNEGIDLNESIIAYCQSGIRASSLMLVLEMVGAKKVSVYNGSWFEYSQRSEDMLDKIITRLTKFFDSLFNFVLFK
ncbi:thiosulfate sulfurtransferase [Brachionus plicatilis]|uniref:Thiosulfate sulfurtransferase n=1 Tax=Brachionus plicatilis TaxID=10195 RepID=A0A3M7QAL4_BRAPC|nr:thiosulfate sulfurtransferase [Brachionus plicatilis]